MIQTTSFLTLRLDIMHMACDAEKSQGEPSHRRGSHHIQCNLEATRVADFQSEQGGSFPNRIIIHDRRAIPNNQVNDSPVGDVTIQKRQHFSLAQNLNQLITNHHQQSQGISFGSTRITNTDDTQVQVAELMSNNQNSNYSFPQLEKVFFCKKVFLQNKDQKRIDMHHSTQAALYKLEHSLERQLQRILREGFYDLLAYYQARKQDDEHIENEVMHHIHETCERSETIRVGLAHFLVPYAVLLRMLQVRGGGVLENCSYISKSIHYILRRMQQPQIEGQIRKAVLLPLLKAVTQTTSNQKLLQYLRMILVSEKELMVCAVPYYYNFFALLLNQRVYFRGSREHLLQYSVQFNFDPVQPFQVRLSHVRKAIAGLQKALRKEYHSINV